jgi:orotate phosphoribosyltransferase
MNRFFYVVLLALLTTHIAVHAKIIETAHFKDLHTHISKDSLIILDIDDTLLITKQMLGCDEWFMARLQEAEQNGLTKNQALETTLAEWEAIRHLTKMEIVETGSDAIIKKLQDEGYTVMGLTTQGLALATRTSTQLQENGINLLGSAPHKTDECIIVNGHTILYRNGILFTSGTSKGTALFSLCEKIGYTPKQIVFINDKATHLKDIEDVAHVKGVEFIGLRYAYSDLKKQAFNPEIAHHQFTNSSFAHILTDQEAEVALKQATLAHAK